ncbi:MAG: DsbA family protein [Cytophagales bacterium]|nr:DsbA family protein [Armatimonadota bacterium]
MPPPLELTGDPDERNYKSANFVLGSLTTVTLYHDYICPWCWIGFIHAQRLQAQYDLRFDWRGAELIPPGMPYEAAPPKPANLNAPPASPAPKGRFDLFVQTEGLVMPEPRPKFVRTHSALLGAEWAWHQGGDVFDRYNAAVYRAYWEQQKDIGEVAVLVKLAEEEGIDAEAMTRSIREERYNDNIVPFDDAAYATGIRHVPTFLFGAEESLAEANYSDLTHAAERFLFRRERHRARKGSG